ncbi:MAG: hypothetical protein OXE81_03940, partial [Gammaproteobacteria bacterium]|nr:hypothetical protein [Gammaproteobacteria bacterium]
LKLGAHLSNLSENWGAPHSLDPDKQVYDLVSEQAEHCLTESYGVKLENKVVLAIATRLKAERFMSDRISDPQFLESLQSNQTYKLTDRFRKQFPDEDEALGILDRVVLMTPENIHLNSFMYEPLIDMSDDYLRKLYKDVCSLISTYRVEG